MSETRKKLGSLSGGKTSASTEQTLWRRANRAWIRRSQAIALRVLTTLRERGMTQTALASAMGVSPQQINKVVRGKENLTLETIAALEEALGVDLMTVVRPAHTMQMTQTGWLGYMPAGSMREVVDRYVDMNPSEVFYPSDYKMEATVFLA